MQVLSDDDSWYGSLRFFNAHAALAVQIIRRLEKNINKISLWLFLSIGKLAA